jgi:hypothetical protein
VTEKAGHDFNGRYDRPCVERDLRQWNNGNAADEKDRQSGWVSRIEENVGGDFVLHFIPEHEEAYNGHAQVEEKAECIRYIDCPTVLVRVTHITINVGKDRMPSPGSCDRKSARIFQPLVKTD